VLAPAPAARESGVPAGASEGVGQHARHELVASFGGRDKTMKQPAPETLERALTVLEVPHDAADAWDRIYASSAGT
jgi:hypothetical protein